MEDIFGVTVPGFRHRWHYLYLWRWPDSNRCPNIFVESFLHAYFIITCRQWTGNEQTNSSRSWI